MKITILGSGTSHGIPVVGCSCRVCRSRDAKDKRTRASIFIEGRQGEKVIIDTGPEFRLQAVRAGIRRLDAAFLTHAHADHVHGLDDVRPLCRDQPLPVYANKKTVEELRERFSYVFRETQRGGGKPRLELIEAGGPVRTGNLLFTPIPVKHGALDILAWRVDEGEIPDETDASGPAAVYLTDTSAIPPASLSLIEKPDILIIDGLRQRPHETHFSFEEALSTAAALKAGRVYLTHICHDYTHREINRYCGDFIKKRKLKNITMEAAWDGLVISVSRPAVF
jgi:phosphoribosyl 1,2-cyclic phosphate phosphodiesterase